MREKLVIKMMKYGLPQMGAKMVVNELSEEQVLASYLSYDYLMDVIEMVYYKNPVRSLAED